MKKVIDTDTPGKVNKSARNMDYGGYFHIEISTLEAIKMIDEYIEEHPDWVPGKTTVTAEDSKQILESLKSKVKNSEK